MFVLDTNVISETLKPTPAVEVVRWLDSVPQSSLHSTAIVKAEVLHGIERLPEGRRKSTLSAAADFLFNMAFEGKILPFDASCAPAYAKILARAQSRSSNMDQTDAMIAAVVAANGGILITRNVKDFEGSGLPLINPWNPL